MESTSGCRRTPLSHRSSPVFAMTVISSPGPAAALSRTYFGAAGALRAGGGCRGAGRGGERLDDAAEGLVVVRRGEEPGLEDAGRQGDPRVEHRVEERRGPPPPPRPGGPAGTRRPPRGDEGRHGGGAGGGPRHPPP